MSFTDPNSGVAYPTSVEEDSQGIIQQILGNGGIIYNDGAAFNPAQGGLFLPANPGRNPQWARAFADDRQGGVINNLLGEIVPIAGTIGGVAAAAGTIGAALGVPGITAGSPIVGGGAGFGAGAGGSVIGGGSAALGATAAGAGAGTAAGTGAAAAGGGAAATGGGILGSGITGGQLASGLLDYGLPIALAAGGLNAAGDIGGNIPSVQQQLDLARGVRDMNLVNTQGPFGSSGYTIGPDGRVTQTSLLSPQLQSLFDQSIGGLQGAMGALSQPFDPNAYGSVQRGVNTQVKPGQIQGGLDYSSLPGLYEGMGYMDLAPGIQDYTPELINLFEGVMPYTDRMGTLAEEYSRGATELQGMTGEDTRGRVEDALYERLRRRLDPLQQQRETALYDRLANMGATAGGEFYNREQEDFNTDRATQDREAMIEAILQGGAEQSRLLSNRASALQPLQNAFGMNQQGANTMFGQNLNANQFGLAAANQYFNQDLNTRNQLFGFDQNIFNQNLAGRQQGQNELFQQGNFANAAQAQDFGQQAAQAGLNLQGGAFANQAQQQGFTQGLQGRQQGGAELGLFGNLFGNIANMAPGGYAPGQISTPNLFDQYNAQVGADTARLGNQAQIVGGLFDLFGQNRRNSGSGIQTFPYTDF